MNDLARSGRLQRQVSSPGIGHFMRRASPSEIPPPTHERTLGLDQNTDRSSRRSPNPVHCLYVSPRAKNGELLQNTVLLVCPSRSTAAPPYIHAETPPSVPAPCHVNVRPNEKQQYHRIASLSHSNQSQKRSQSYPDQGEH